jgi:hypothetical protein
LAEENRLWGAPRIHGELLKLGIVVSERTVSRYLRACPRRPSQTWRTFLVNHLGQFRCISSVISPGALADDVVDATAVTCRSTPVSDRLSASSQCVLVDWRASIGTTTGSCVSQDQCRDFTGMRRSASRAPPSTYLCSVSRRAHCKSIPASRTGPTAIRRPRETVARRQFAIGTNHHPEVGRLGFVLTRPRGDSRGRSGFWRTTRAAQRSSSAN